MCGLDRFEPQSEMEIQFTPLCPQCDCCARKEAWARLRHRLESFALGA